MTTNDVRKLIRSNLRDYGMYIALIVIMGIFTIATKGLFLSSRNIANLLNQTGYIAVLAFGMTLVIVIRHIDLSVGFLAGFLGAIAAIGLTTWGLPVIIVLPMTLMFGTLAGLITAYPVAKLGVPAFVASLAGWLIYRGAILLVTAKTGTIIIPNAIFNAIGNGYIPDIIRSETFLPEMHKLTLILGALTIVWFIFKQIQTRKNKIAYKFDVIPNDLFIVKLILISIAIGFITWILAGYNGLSWTVVIVLAIAIIYDYITQQTILAATSMPLAATPKPPNSRASTSRK